MKFRIVFLGQDGDESATPESADQDAFDHHVIQYKQRGSGVVRIEQLESGRKKITALANFVARITADVIIDDGEDESREFELEAMLDGETISFSIPAGEFGRDGLGGEKTWTSSDRLSRQAAACSRRDSIIVQSDSPKTNLD